MTEPSQQRQTFSRITEVCRLTGESRRTIGKWENSFRQINPVKRPGGHRYYRRETVNLIRGVSFLIRRCGYAVEGVKRLLKEYGNESVARVGIHQDLAYLTTELDWEDSSDSSPHDLPEKAQEVLLATAAELRDMARALQT